MEGRRLKMVKEREKQGINRREIGAVVLASKKKTFTRDQWK